MVQPMYAGSSTREWSLALVSSSSSGTVELVALWEARVQVVGSQVGLRASTAQMRHLKRFQLAAGASLVNTV